MDNAGVDHLQFTESHDPKFEKDSPRIRLFGSVSTVAPDGSEIQWHSTIEACLLGYLASQSGVPVRRDKLVELFWPELDHTEGRRRLRQRIYKVKERLGCDRLGDTSILSSNNFVRLDLGAVRVDVLIFEKLLRSTQASTSFKEKVDRLTTAVQLWRGPFLHAFDLPWIEFQRARYDRAYSAAVSELADLLCALRMPDKALEQIEHALQHLPLQETLHIAAMRAHAAAGNLELAVRQFEVYEELLDAELGERPSDHALRALQNLPHPSTLSRNSERVVAPKSLFPQFLGAPFVGRADSLDQLWQILSPNTTMGTQVVCVTGPPGVGKTRLVAALADKYQEDISDQCWLISPESNRDTELFWKILADQIELSFDDTQSSSDLVVKHINTSQALIILDDCDHTLPAVEHFTCQITATCPFLKVLITSRVHTGLEGVHHFIVKTFDMPEDDEVAMRSPAYELFEQTMIRTGRTKALPHEIVDIIAICRELDGLPLAIVLAAVRTNLLTPTLVLGGLRASHSILEADRNTTDNRKKSLSATLDWTFDRLSKEARATLSCLSFLDTSFSLDTVSACSGMSPAGALRAVQELVDASWVQRHEANGQIRLSILRTIREYVKCKAEVSEQEIIAKLAEHLIQWLSGRNPFLKGPFSTATRQEMADELALMHSVMNRCHTLGLHGASVSLLGTLKELFEQIRSPAGWVELARKVVSDSDPVPPGLASAALTLGQLEVEKRNFELAQTAFELAVSLATEDGDLRVRLLGMNGQSVALSSLGQFERAVTLLSKVGSAVSLRSDPMLFWKVKINQGYACEWAGDIESAMTLYNDSLVAARIINDGRIEAISLEAIAQVRSLEEPTAEQVDKLTEAVRALSLFTDERRLAYGKANLGLALCLAHKHVEGTSLLLEATSFDVSDEEWRSLRTNLTTLAFIMSLQGDRQLSQNALSLSAAADLQTDGTKLELEELIKEQLSAKGILPTKSELRESALSGEVRVLCAQICASHGITLGLFQQA